MKKIEKVYLLTWVSRPNLTRDSRVYVRRSYAQDYHAGLQMGGAINPKITSFEVGETVCLTREASKSQRCPRGRGNNKTAKIRTLLRDPKGGVITDRDLRGIPYWNLLDLEKVN